MGSGAKVRPSPLSRHCQLESTLTFSCSCILVGCVSSLCGLHAGTTLPIYSAAKQYILPQKFFRVPLSHICTVASWALSEGSANTWRRKTSP